MYTNADTTLPSEAFQASANPQLNSKFRTKDPFPPQIPLAKQIL